jgi:hypothetical protein
MARTLPKTKAGLYEEDFNLWLEAQASLLREGRLDELDIENLIEEVKAIGRSERHALESNLIVVLVHLLKYRYQPTRSWLLTLREHRRRLRRSLQDSPSLRRFAEDNFLDCYQEAREQAALESGLEVTDFPGEPPYTLAQALDQTFFPGENDARQSS